MHVLKVGEDMIGHMMKDGIDKDTGLSETFLKDLPRAKFVFNHRLLSQAGNADTEEAVRTFKEAFRTEEGIDEAAARTVSLLFNQRSIHPYAFSATQAALGGDIGSADTRSTYEAWKADNGDWFVRSTNALTPRAIARMDGSTEMLNTPGTIAHSVTYRISAESIASGAPTVKIADAKSMFNF